VVCGFLKPVRFFGNFCDLLIYMEALWIQTPAGRIFSKVAGLPGSPLVLGIHGWSQRNGWHTWEPMMEPLAAAGFRVVSVDMPGWGQSVPASPELLTGERAVLAVVAILDELKQRTAVLMGKSWGGGVALAVALAYPQRVNKLILTAPAGRDLDRLARLTPPVLLAWSKDDPVIPYKQAAAFVSAVPYIQLESYETGGHSAATKNAADFAPKAIEFLKRIA
jgi:pimeloyl-ACP methyl ester carboxylesterase